MNYFRIKLSNKFNIKVFGPAEKKVRGYVKLRAHLLTSSLCEIFKEPNKRGPIKIL